MPRPGRLGIGVVGAGKVGAVLGAALRAAEHAVVGVHAVSEESRERAEALLPGVPILPIPDLVRRAELVLLAVPDDALGPLVKGLADAGHWQAGQLVVHTAGRYGTGILEPARAAGAIPLAIHPAMSFTGMSLDLERRCSCMFGVTADRMMLPIAQALVVEMGAEYAVIEEEDRGIYHAALAHASNHLVTIAGQSAQASHRGRRAPGPGARAAHAGVAGERAVLGGRRTDRTGRAGGRRHRRHPPRRPGEGRRLPGRPRRLPLDGPRDRPARPGPRTAHRGPGRGDPRRLGLSAPASRLFA